MSQRLKLLKRLKEVDIESLAEGLEILERVKTNTSRVEDRERLAHLIRVTVEVTEQICTAPDAPERPPSKTGGDIPVMLRYAVALVRL